MYATYNPERGQPAIVRLSDWAFISIDEASRDYRAYLAWLEEGNTPEPWGPEDADVPLS